MARVPRSTTSRAPMPRGLQGARAVGSRTTAGVEVRLEELRAEYGTRPERGVAPSENKQAFIKREIYLLVRSFGVDGRGRSAIQALVRRDGNEPRTPLFEQNPFHWALLAFDPLRVDVARQPTLRRIANQLLYADRNHVPEQLLVGFLYQIGAPDDIYAKVEEDRREPWFRSYVRSARHGRACRSVTSTT